MDSLKHLAWSLSENVPRNRLKTELDHSLICKALRIIATEGREEGEALIYAWKWPAALPIKRGQQRSNSLQTVLEFN